MTNDNSNKTQRNRVWEKERRNRLCAAFAALAEVLPSTPSTATKILILQRSVKYIKELQQKNFELQDAESKHPANISALLDKLSILEERCSQLIQHIQQSGVPVTPSILLNAKELTTPEPLLAPVISENSDKIDTEVDKSTTEVPKVADELKIDKLVESNETSDDVKNKIIEICDPVKNNEKEISQDDKSEISQKTMKTLKKTKIIKKKILKKSVFSPNTYTLVSSVGMSSSSEILTSSNVWVTNNNENGSVLVGNIGNMLLPIMPKTSPLLMSSNTQPPTILLFQRPLIQNHQNIIKDCVLSNNLALTKIGCNGNRVSSNILGLDVTKTTMVNKVPIPAISSTNSLVKCKNLNQTAHFKVSAKAHRKLKKTLKVVKKTESATPILSDKENLSKVEIKEASANEDSNKIVLKPTSDITNSSGINVIDNESSNAKKNDTTIDKAVAERNKIKSSDSGENGINCEIIDNIESQKHPLECIESIKTVERINGSERDFFISSENKNTTNSDKIVGDQKGDNNSETNISKPSAKKNLIAELNKSLNSSTVICISKNLDMSHENASKSKKPIENQENFEKATTNKVLNSKMIKSNEIDLNKQSVQDISRISQNSDCNLQSLKSVHGNHILNSSDLPEDLLASFVAPPEQTSSPLASSPLATSPTAAFLLAFPLVCPGPRPDTPTNDNLQTPNLCSLDNFSTFFSTKDSIAANSLSIVHSHVFNDCLPKPLIQNSPEKIKHSWVQSQNNHNFLKPTPELSDAVKIEECSRTLSNNKESQEKQSPSNSSTCAYSQGVGDSYNNTKITNMGGQYSLTDNIFNYEQISQKDQSNAKNSVTSNSKNNFNFENSQNNLNKIKQPIGNSCSSSVASYLENIPSSIACTNLKPYNYGTSTLNMSDSNNCKRNQTIDGSIKLDLSITAPELPTASKNIDIPFSFQTQSKAMFPNSSNIYTSCNTYNPFSSDFSSNSMNLGIPCGNTLNTVRTKSSATYFPEFAAYSQNSNIWNEDNQIDYDPNKIDHSKKISLPISLNQNISHNVISDAHIDFRLSLPPTSKCSTNKQISMDPKNLKSNKYVGKDTKFSSTEKQKSDFMNQKGPVNWMTSDVVAQHNNETYFPNYKEIKSEQNFMLSNSNQPCIDPASNISSLTSLNCKKGDIFEQPFFHIPPTGYVSQVVNEDNFTWSPSKLTTFGDNSLAVPCSLPTLVGDLALGITEPKLSYQTLTVEQDNLMKERKSLQKNKESFNVKPNGSQPIEINSSHAGNYFSVSHLMDRGKIVENSDNNKPCIQDKRTIPESENRNFSSHLNVNKVYGSSNACGPGPNFSSDNYAIQASNNHGLIGPKNNSFNNKLDSNSKNVNKNNYSAESLLQNDNPNYQNIRKSKPNSSVQKIYSDNAGYAIHSNQFIASNHPLPFDNFSQNQQYGNNTFPYTSSSVSMNSTFYTSSNFIPSANMSSSNYMNNGFTADLGDFQNTSENMFYVPKMETCKPKLQGEGANEFPKYVYNSKTATSSKDVSTKNKLDANPKKEISLPNKRQKKSKNNYSNNFGIPDRCFGSVSNQVNAPIVMDESYFAYNSSAQIHQFQSQPGLLTVQNAGQHSQKSNFGSKLGPNTHISNSPNTAGTSLTNFNLSTIFPEIVKRPNMAGFNDTTHHSSGQPSKASLPGMFN